MSELNTIFRNLNIFFFSFEDITFESYTLEGYNQWTSSIENRFGNELPRLGVDSSLFA